MGMEDTGTEEEWLQKRTRIGTPHDFSVAYPFSDVKLVSGSGAVLYGCRYNLALRSPVCNRMLLSGMKETQPMSEMVSIPFPGMTTEALLVLLEFCTSGHFSDEWATKAPVDVIHAARYFQLVDDIHMEELMGRVVAKVFELGAGNGWSEVDIPLCDLVWMVSHALECLSTDLDASFFEMFIKMIFWREVTDLPVFSEMSSKTLEFLLSKTVRCCWEPWASTFRFCSSEFSIFKCVLLWSACETPHYEADKLLESWMEHGIPNILARADLLESTATIAQPFLPFIDFSLIDPWDIVRFIQPLKIVPADMLLEALSHHALAPSMSKPIMYRGSCVLQWHPDAHSPDLTTNGMEERISTASRRYRDLQGPTLA